jgi:hypothetical protein
MFAAGWQARRPEMSDKTTRPTYWVVIAFRYGSNVGPFPIGVFPSKDAAILAAMQHRAYRGGKYNHRIYEFFSGIWDDDIGNSGYNSPCIEDQP